MEYGTCEGYNPDGPNTPPAQKVVAELTTVAVVGAHYYCTVNGETRVLVTSISRCDTDEFGEPVGLTPYGYDNDNLCTQEDRNNMKPECSIQPIETTDLPSPGTGPDRNSLGTRAKGVGDTPPASDDACPLWYSMMKRTCDDYMP